MFVPAKARLGNALACWQRSLTGSASEEHAQGGAAVAVTLNLAGFGLFGPDLNIAYGSEFTGFVRARGFGLPST
jgi:hypothetical protein